MIQDAATARRRHETSDKASIPDHFSAKVVGLTFHGHYPDNLLALAAADVPVTLTLARNPDNPYDSWAIEVRAPLRGGGDDLLGHLPRAVAGRVGREMDKGEQWRITGWTVLVDQAHPAQPGLSITLERVDQ